MDEHTYQLYRPLAQYFRTLPPADPIENLPSPTEYNPNSTGGGGAVRKALRLETDTMLLTPLIIILLLGFAFAAGIYVGTLRAQQEFLNQRLSQLENAKIEYKPSTPTASGSGVEQQKNTAERKIPSSSVMKYPSPEAMRKRDEKISVATIEQEMLTLAKEFGGKGSMDVL